MFANKLTAKKNEKRVSLSVLAASKSVRRSIKFVNKQSKFHLSCHNKKLENVVETKSKRMATQSISDVKSKIESNNVMSDSKTPSTNTIGLKERIAMSSNRLAMNKHPVESIRQRNQFNTPNTAKRPNLASNNSNQSKKGFNSAHINYNTNSSSNNKSNLIVQRKLFTPSISSGAQTPKIKATRLITPNDKIAKTPSFNAKTPSNRFNSNLTDNLKSAKNATASSIKNNFNRAKSSVRRSIQLLNNNLKTPTTSNIRKNLFQNGSKIPVYTPSSKKYPKTDERKPTQSKISEQIKNLTKTTEIKTRRRSSRFSGRLSEIESSCLILTPKLMRQLLAKASESTGKPEDIDKIVEEEEEEEPIKVKTIKPSSLIKYLFSEKQKLYDADTFKAKLNEVEQNKNENTDNVTKENIDTILTQQNSLISKTDCLDNTNNINNDVKVITEHSNETIKFLHESNKEKEDQLEKEGQNQVKETKDEVIHTIVENTDLNLKESSQMLNPDKHDELEIDERNNHNEESIEVIEKRAYVQDQQNIQQVTLQNESQIKEKIDNSHETSGVNCEEIKIVEEKNSNQNTIQDNIDVSIDTDEDSIKKEVKSNQEIITEYNHDKEIEKVNEIDNETQASNLNEKQKSEMQQHNENLIENKLQDKVSPESPNRTTDDKKSEHYRENVPNFQIDESVATSIENQENIPIEPITVQKINEEDFSIGKTIEIQTDFDLNENDDNNPKSVEKTEPKIMTEGPVKISRKKREKKEKIEKKPLEDIVNEERVLTRAQRAKLNQKA